MGVWYVFPCVWGEEWEGRERGEGGGDEVWDNDVIGSLLDTWIFTMENNTQRYIALSLLLYSIRHTPRNARDLHGDMNSTKG